MKIIFFKWRNYHARVVEVGEVKKNNECFYYLKGSATVIESGSSITYPTDYENDYYKMELSVFIGGFRTSKSDVGECLFGYAYSLDMTLHSLQLKFRTAGRPWGLGKKGLGKKGLGKKGLGKNLKELAVLEDVFTLDE